MKILLRAMLVLTVLSLVSCKESEKNAEVQESQPQEHGQSQGQKMADADSHTVIVEEVVSGNSYTYLKVKEDDAVFWIAITKREIETGGSISFKEGLEMVNFTSKELQRTFETIYFVSDISDASSLSESKRAEVNPHEGLNIEKKVISIEPVEGGISIGELFSNRDSYAKKIVRIKGQVMKFNRAIMGKNWVHLQDGTGAAGGNDLLVTTQDVVSVGDVVVFEGTIALNKDFGSGYSYAILMEEAKRQP